MQLDTNRLHPDADCNHPMPKAGCTALNAGWPDSPTLRFKELLTLLRVSRSKAYELMKTDQDFPKGIPLYDSVQSPKFYWTHEAIAWVEGRNAKYRTQQEGC